MARTKVRNITLGAVTLPMPYNYPLEEGGSVVIDDAAATVITNLGGASAIARVFDVEEVSDATPSDITATGETGLVADITALAVAKAAGASGRFADAAHAHTVGTAVLGLVANVTKVDGAATAAGASGLVARADHKHGIDDRVYGDHQDLAGAGAIDLTHRTSYLTTAAPGVVQTLADGAFVGQRKSLICTTVGTPGTDTIVVTPASGGPWTLSAAGDHLELEWDGTNWVTVADVRHGATVADIDGSASAVGTNVAFASADHVHGFDARIYGAAQTLVGAGAIDIAHRTSNLGTAAAGVVQTLADGAFIGQRKSLICNSLGTPGVDTIIVTPANGGPWTLDALNESLEIEWNGAAWVLVCDNRLPVTDDSLTGAQVAVIANDNLQGGIPVCHVVAIAAGAANKDLVLVEKTEILDVTVVKIGASGGAGPDTLQLQTAAGANNITTTMDIHTADGAITRAASIDTAFNVIAAGGTLRLAAVGADDCACRVYINGVKRA